VLSRAIHDLAAEAVASRQHSRLLHRRMNDNIRRETKRATLHLQRQAATDPLTELGNRRTLEQRLQEYLRTNTSGCLLAVVAIDLDLFKEVNDTLGHDVGDQCLVFLANLLLLGSKFLVLCSWFCVLGSGFWVLGSGFWVLGSEPRE
jgi:PleD family two-component response regulator